MSVRDRFSTTLPKRISGLMRLFRLEIPLGGGLCVVTGQILGAGVFPAPWQMISGFLCGFALAAAAVILNDLFDFETDLVNAPYRPLPSGAVTRGEVIGLSAAAALSALGSGLALGLLPFALAVFILFIGFLYNWRLKQAGLAGNLAVGASVGLTFPLGAVAAGAPGSPLAWTFCLMVFLLIAGEEIASDVMDMEGDRLRSCRSVPLIRGRRYALILSSAFLLAFMLVSLLPMIMGWLAVRFTIFFVLTDLLLGYFMVRLIRSRSLEEGRQAAHGLYGGAAVGLGLGVMGFLVWGSLV